MRRFLGGFFKTSSTLVLTAGVVGVLVGVERLLSTPRATPRTRLPDVIPPTPEPVAEVPVKPVPIQPPPPIAPPPAVVAPKPPRNFSIKRTKSEVGYVYWILEGYGKHKCFVLCDSWEEAVEQARVRLETADEEIPELVYARAK